MIWRSRKSHARSFLVLVGRGWAGCFFVGAQSAGKGFSGKHEASHQHRETRRSPLLQTRIREPEAAGVAAAFVLRKICTTRALILIAGFPEGEGRIHAK